MHKLDEGAVTNSYQLNREQSIAILNEALASEIVCVLRYQHHYFMASGVHGRSVAQTFKDTRSKSGNTWMRSPSAFSNWAESRILIRDRWWSARFRNMWKANRWGR